MKQINSNYIRKQFGPAPIFLIAASIIMATTSVSLLHSGGLIPVIPGLGGALYFANEVLRDDVALTPTLSSYDHLHFRNYEGSIYESTASISSKVNTIDKKIKYDWSFYELNY